MSDIVAFIRARLDERELLALATTRGKWYAVADHKDSIELRPLLVKSYDGVTPEEMAYTGGAIVAASSDWLDEAVENAAFIAANDPQYVLDDIAAKRQIIEQYVETLHNARQHKGDLPLAGASLALLGAVKSLASAYADHPDYTPENWKFG